MHISQAQKAAVSIIEAGLQSKSITLAGSFTSGGGFNGPELADFNAERDAKYLLGLYSELVAGITTE